MKDTCYIFSPFFALLQSSCYNLYVNFGVFCYTPITEVTSLNCKEKVTCEYRSNRTTPKFISRYRKRSTTGSTTFVQNAPIFQQHPRQF